MKLKLLSLFIVGLFSVVLSGYNDGRIALAPKTPIPTTFLERAKKAGYTHILNWVDIGSESLWSNGSVPGWTETTCPEFAPSDNGFSYSFRSYLYDIDYNKIGQLPDSIGALSNLQRLDRSLNLIKILPGSLAKLNKCSNFTYHHNHLCSISDTIKTWITSFGRVVRDPDTTQICDAIH